MTLEEFKNLKVGDEIVFKNISFKINRHGNYQDITTLDATSVDSEYVYIAHDTMSANISGCLVVGFHKILFKESLNSIGLATKKSEKELIQEQIKTLQDKLIEIEKNDVENVIKNLVSGQFIEVTYKDSFDPSPYIYRFDNIYNKNLTIYSYKLGQSWQISTHTISKIIVRNDITEAYNKFISFVKSTD